jgi:squalene-hopene/tetraprenyl-beta-curcumene cyclase
MRIGRQPQIVALLVLALLAGPSRARAAEADQARLEQIDRALARAAIYLMKHQDADGAWRSEIYGPFKDGGSLTPLVLNTLQSTPASRPHDVSYRRGVAYLTGLVKADGSIDAGKFGLSYPVYTSAGAVVLLSQPNNAAHRKARDAWLAFLRERQLTEALGWQPADKPFGGWGYCPVLPRKATKPGDFVHPLTESNLSATISALEALHAAGGKPDDPAFAKALVFVRRCQNFPDDPKQRDPALDDGGFFFIYDDAVRNKAGVAGKDRQGRERFHSYGSMTADGLRALLLCGQKPEDHRVKAARDWLEKHFRADVHPGKYAEGREVRRAAVYYYYCSSVAQTLRLLKTPELQTEKGKVRWAEALVAELLQRQQKDGSWVSEATEFREDDPLVATCFAATALAQCRWALTGKPLDAFARP